MVEQEEKRQLEELKLARKQSQQEQQQTDTSTSAVGANQSSLASRSPSKQAPKVASNLNVHRRNMWIKCALI